MGRLGRTTYKVKLIFAPDQPGKKRMYHHIRETKSLLSWYINCACEINTNTHFISSFAGFEFIQQPKAFDAYMCRGRCPARYNALNDHSLLQSIMHLKTKKHSNSRNRVHKPCCVGTKFQPLDILHVDDKNPSKLKVTHWKNVIVSDCGCA